MPRNGQGIYTLPVGNPVITGTTITSTWGNTTMQDIANALTGSVASDGQTTMSGPLNMGSNRINNVDNPVLPQDAATMDYVDNLVGDLGTMARQNADNVQIIGGSIQGVLLNLGGTTGQMYLPRGTDGQKTASPQPGILRWNTTQNIYEGFTGTQWVRFQTFPEGNYNVSYLVVAGGGGGKNGIANDNNFGGGAGGGGVRSDVFTLGVGQTYNIVVGAGGGAGANGGNSSFTGPNSVIISSCTGGGYGGTNIDTVGAQGGNGGCGGGSGRGAAGGYQPGTGIPGEGYNGANSGGGAAAPGNGGYAATGGAGKYSEITGTGAYYGGGGGSSDGLGGVGGGGKGGQGQPDRINGYPGTPLTGGGGGACGGYTTGGGAGGSGIVILSVLTAYYSGLITGNPTVTINGDDTILSFTQSGTYTA